MKHLLKMMDLSGQDIERILNLADALKLEQRQGVMRHPLKGKTLAMIFEKNSTRTRVSFEVGMYQLGGHAIFLSNADSQIGRGEPIQDTARVLSRYCNGIMIRTYAQETVDQLAEWSSVPVINGLSDQSHPCQVLADLMTVRERFKKLSGLKLCYIGDGNNMANALIIGGLKCGMSVSVACPEGYEPGAKSLEFALHAGGDFTLTADPKKAAEGADVVFTDVWASMGQEKETAARKKAFAGFCVNSELMKVTNSAMVQHCLPAHHGEEITEEVFEAHATEIFDEAENRLHAQKAVMELLMA
ncbi:MAG: ornithine carbamoyltransferase [Oscillospiraceae bacterium]|jgi:ornithine carbamoyltransferase|nr:ornithine carbamoyltransferase [Oscillospiraceae bacterium]